MRVGLAVDIQPRAAIVKDHVTMVLLPPALDVAGEKAGAFGFRDRERLAWCRWQGDVALGMKPQRR